MSIFIEFCCIWFFLFEIILNFIYKGFKQFFKSGWAYFNLIVWLAGFYYSYTTISAFIDNIRVK